MEYSFDQDDAAARVELSGSFTFQDYKVWREVVEQSLATGQTKHVVDLTHLDNIDSAGLGMLLYMKDEAAKRSFQMYIKHTGEGLVRTMLYQAEVEKLIPFCDE